MGTLRFKKIIVPVDFSNTALHAVDHAALLAKKNDAEIRFVHILEPISNLGWKMTYPSRHFGLTEEHLEMSNRKQDELNERMETHVKQSLELIENKLKKDGINVKDSIIETGKIHKKIGSIARKYDTDLIVMGTHGSSGVREFVVGSNTAKVVYESVCPVLSIREKVVLPGFKNILLPFIDKPHMREHVDYAIQLAKIYGATIDVLGIDTEKETNHFRKVKTEAEQIKKIAAKSGVKINTDVYPSAYVNKFIMGYSREKRANLIIMMADMNKMNMMQYFTGPVVQQVINHSPIPVLSIPPAYNPVTGW